MVHGIVIPHDEDQAPYIREFNRLEDYQSAVGGLIEAIDLEPMDATFFAHEEAKLIDLPINRRATLLWWMNRQRMGDTIRGDAVLVGMPDGEGHTQDVPEAVRFMLLEGNCYKAEFQTFEGNDYYTNALEFGTYFEAAAHALDLASRWNAVRDCRVKMVA